MSKQTIFFDVSLIKKILAQKIVESYEGVPLQSTEAKFLIYEDSKTGDFLGMEVVYEETPLQERKQ